MSTKRLSIKFEDWPARDRAAFENAVLEVDATGETGLAAYWSRAWRQSAAKRYGMWLHFLCRHDLLELEVPPLERLTKQRLRDFIAELSVRVSSVTVFTYVTGMAEVLRVMSPNEKRPKFLRRALGRLERAALPSRDERSRLVAPYQLFKAGLRRMQRYQLDAATCSIAAVRFQDGLMMCVLIAKAVRLKNFSGIVLGKNIAKNHLDQFELSFAKRETKTKVPIKAELPQSLSRSIEYYLDVVRPTLLAGRSSDAMWISATGTDMAPATVYERFCRATYKELQKRINPQLVRKIVATGVAFAAPGEVSITPVLLDHTNSKTEKEFYNLAGSLTASAARLRLLEPRRRRAIDDTN